MAALTTCLEGMVLHKAGQAQSPTEVSAQGKATVLQVHARLA